ncbi:MAG TPA: type I methionyl aminopeptidase [Actinomycetes bacterium]|jgi:methionyl aminopeptidase|nr:type I methionyl aminopeptidase [Actinomycetes bacterium]
MIVRKSPEELDRMRRAGRLVGHTLSLLAAAARPGVSLLELDRLAERTIRGARAVPSFLGYHGFPATLCLSPNDRVVHGIPSRYVLRQGDILSIDCGAIVEGYHGDAAVTVPIGQVDEAARRLIATTERAMWAGIAQVRAGNRLSDIGHAVERVAREPGYGVVREYVGHGIGTRMHEEPQVPNYGRPGRGLRLDVGLVLAIEPMVNEGGAETEVLDDGWTVVTRDGSRSAHFEHTVAITPDGPEVLTLLDGARQQDWLPPVATQLS